MVWRTKGLQQTVEFWMNRIGEVKVKVKVLVFQIYERESSYQPRTSTLARRTRRGI